MGSNQALGTDMTGERENCKEMAQRLSNRRRQRGHGKQEIILAVVKSLLVRCPGRTWALFGVPDSRKHIFGSFTFP